MISKLHNWRHEQVSHEQEKSKKGTGRNLIYLDIVPYLLERWYL